MLGMKDSTQKETIILGKMILLTFPRQKRAICTVLTGQGTQDC